MYSVIFFFLSSCPVLQKAFFFFFLNQWLSTGGDFACQLSMSGDIFVVTTWDGHVTGVWWVEA